MTTNKTKPTIQGKRFRAALKYSGVSRAEFSQLLSVHMATIQYWTEHGVSARHVTEASDLLGISATTIQSPFKNKTQSKKLITYIKPETYHSATNQHDTLHWNKIAKPKIRLPATDYESQLIKRSVTQRSIPINLDLLNLIASKKMTVQQEQVVLNLANTFVQENQYDMQSNG